MATATFLLDALVASPTETLAWLEQCCADSCELVAMGVASVIVAMNVARESDITQCRALARAQTKLATATLEGLRNVAAGLDAIASLCASATASTPANNVEAATAALAEGRRGRRLVLDLQADWDAMPNHCWSTLSLTDVGALDVYFNQWVDVPTLDGCQFICVVCKDKYVHMPAECWPRGQRAFTLRVNVITVRSKEILAALRLRPDAVAVAVHGDDTATWTCAQCPDECGILVTYTAASQVAEVELTVHVLGTAVYKCRLVSRECLMILSTFICVSGRAFICRHPASAQGPAVSNVRFRWIPTLQHMPWRCGMTASHWPRRTVGKWQCVTWTVLSCIRLAHMAWAPASFGIQAHCARTPTATCWCLSSGLACRK